MTFQSKMNGSDLKYIFKGHFLTYLNYIFVKRQ